MKTSQRIYLTFKRLIGLLGSFAGFIFMWQWAIPVSVNNEEDLKECNEKYANGAFNVKLGDKVHATKVKLKMEHDLEFKVELDSKYVESISFWLDFKAFYLYFLNLFCALKGR